MQVNLVSCFFFFNDTATTEIYTLSLHDALPISLLIAQLEDADAGEIALTRMLIFQFSCSLSPTGDRKSTRLNSSHVEISYAVFCLKKKRSSYRRSCSARSCRGKVPRNSGRSVSH